MNWIRTLPAACALLVTMTSAATRVEAAEPIRSGHDVDEICRFSAPISQDVGEDEARARRAYQLNRRRLAQEVMEITVPSMHLAIIGYDRVTGVLSVSGLRDKALFEGQHFLRFREGCVLHFDVSEERARDLIARSQLGSIGLRIGFLLGAHDDYDKPFCASEAATATESASAQVEAQVEAKTVLLADLLYAHLVESDGQALATYQSELGHQLHLRRVSQAVGAASRAVPRVEVTSLTWVVPAGQLDDSDTPHAYHSWWRGELEAAVYPCYLRGLGKNGRLQGAFVLRVASSQGGATPPEVMLDTLQVDEVTSCIVERVQAIAQPQNDTRRWTHFKATMLFKLN
ncbi:MAG: hypothetical protein H0U74_14660 [Bradymonadaceae bacterium]|nr:hypothetical protein [Lujinxingiaceae bacterium]